MATLNREQIGEKLNALAGWQYEDNAIAKLYRFKRFMDGIGFIGRIAELAEAADHHPDIFVNYTRVKFTCTTHSAGGVTEKDFKLAAQIEREFNAQRG